MIKPIVTLQAKKEREKRIISAVMKVIYLLLIIIGGFILAKFLLK